MDIEKDIEKIENKVEKTSFAMEMLQYSKEQNKIQKEQFEKSNKRLFIVWFVTFLGLLCAIGYIIYLLNDIGNYEEKTIDIEDVEVIDNSHIKIGDDIYKVGENEWEE